MSLDKLTSSKTPTAEPPRRRRSLTWLLPTGLLVGFLGIFAWLFGDRLLPALEVKTAPVITLRKADSSKTDATSKLEASTKGGMLFQASGWVEPDPYITYVPTLVNGVVKSVHVLAGQKVKKGELLATLVDDDARLDLAEAEQRIKSMELGIAAHCKGTDIAQAELEAARKKVLTAKSQVADAEDNLKRLKSIPEGAIPGQQLVQASLKLQQQRALLAETETQIPRIMARLEQIDEERLAMEAKVEELNTDRDRAQLALDRTRITTPMDAMVLHLHAAPGKKRMLNMDDPKSATIVELYEPEKLQARVDVPLNEAAGIRLGQHVELISDLLPDTVFTGKVTSITGEADLQRNTLQAKIAISNPDARLRPEMLVRAKFFASGDRASTGTESVSGRMSIFVPEGAIVDGSHVWVVSPDNRADYRSLELGNEVRDGHRLVISGLKSGEQVIQPPHDKLKTGIRVSPDSEN